MIGRARSELYTLLLAVQFLTRLPISSAQAYSPERMADSVRHYPLVGVLIGTFAAAVYTTAQLLFPPVVAVILSTVLTVLFTGAFHEDGLADTFDGVGGGLGVERSLEIMKDSRVGTYGAIALFAVLAIKVAALSALASSAVVICLISGHGLSRWSIVVVIASSRYVRDAGTAKPTAEGIGSGSLVYASVTALLCLALIGVVVTPVAAGCAAVGLIAGHAAIRLIFERKLGGYTGDCLGATQQVSEIGVYLGVLACQ